MTDPGDALDRALRGYGDLCRTWRLGDTGTTDEGGIR